MPQDIPELLSLKETSKILGVHRNTLRQWDQKGILKAVRYGERHDRHFKKDDILTLLRKKQEKEKLHRDTEDTTLKISFDRLTRLQKVTEALVKAVTIYDITHVIVHEGTKALDAESGAIFLVAKKKDCIELFDSIGYPQKIMKKLKKIPLKEVMPTTDAVKYGKPVLIESHAEYMLRYPEASLESLAGLSNTFAAIPAFINNDIVGVLSFSFGNTVHFTKDEVTFMMSMANQFSNAFARASKYEDVEIC